MPSKFWQLKIWQAPNFSGYKVLAVLLALLIWIYVTVTLNPLDDKVFTVPVETVNLAQGLAMPETTYKASVRVQGSKADINNLTAADIRAYIDLQDVQAGETSIPVQVEELPENITLVSLSPDTIKITLETEMSESFPLEIKTSGEPAEGYSVVSTQADPTQVMLYGTEDRLQEVASVYVSASLTDLSGNYDERLPIVVLNHNGENITNLFTLSPTSSRLQVIVSYNQPSKTLAVNVLTSGEPATGYQVSRVVSNPTTLVAYGDRGVLDSMHYLDTEPVDLTGLKSSVTVTRNIAHGDNVSVSSETVLVTVEIEPVSTAEFTKDMLFAENVAEGLNCILPSLSLHVVVAGPDTYIGQVAAGDIVPYVDCSGITDPGDYELPVRFNLPANISLVESTPAMVAVTIEAVEAGDESGTGIEIE